MCKTNTAKPTKGVNNGMRLIQPGFLWLLLLEISVGLNISGDIDDFARFQPKLFTQHSVDFLLDRSNLDNLLRIEATRHYGIIDGLFYSCNKLYRLMKGQGIGLLAKEKPWMGFMMAASIYINGLDDAVGSEDEVNNNFPMHHRMAREFPLLFLNLRSDEDVMSLLKNHGHAFQYELFRWLKSKKIDPLALYSNEKTVESGLIHQILDINKSWMSDPELIIQCLEMMKHINHSPDLFGHLTMLRHILMNSDAETSILMDKSTRSLIQEVLISLEKRVTTTDVIDQQPAEEFRYTLLCMSTERIILEKELVKKNLVKYQGYNFWQLAKIIAVKLGRDCREFIGAESRAELMNIPFIDKTLTFGVCFDREERIDYFHRWLRTVPQFLPHKSNKFEPCIKYLLKHFNRLSFDYMGIPLQDFLESQQRLIIGEATPQLKITNVQGVTHIDARRYSIEKDFVDVMTIESLYYLVLSLAKQTYFRSPEIFDEGLLDWIDYLSQMDEDAKEEEEEEEQLFKMLREITSNIYPYNH